MIYYIYAPKIHLFQFHLDLKDSETRCCLAIDRHVMENGVKLRETPWTSLGKPKCIGPSYHLVIT